MMNNCRRDKINENRATGMNYYKQEKAKGKRCSMCKDKKTTSANVQSQTKLKLNKSVQEVLPKYQLEELKEEGENHMGIFFSTTKKMEQS